MEHLIIKDSGIPEWIQESAFFRVQTIVGIKYLVCPWFCHRILKSRSCFNPSIYV